MNVVATQHITSRTVKRNVLRNLTATPVVAAILALGATSAIAAEAQTPAIDEIVVTGSRVVRDGFQAPTPVSVVSVEQMENTATGNLADYVNTLPSLSGSQTPQSTATQINGGRAAINGLNLRSLGVERTLVLLNGQRTAGSVTTGTVDVSELPQQLISRVDIVTGGASAAYGSDALTGVVNFILDTTYTGIKGEVSGGITDYGDRENWKVALTGGTGFANGRGHFLISGEASAEAGILVNDRPWNQEGYGFINNPAYGTNAALGQSRTVPERLAVSQLGLSNASWGGLITSGPLKGTMFGPGGTQSQLVYGSIVADPLMSGGGWKSNTVTDVNGAALAPKQSRQNVFTYASYDLSDNVKVYGHASWGHLYSLSAAVPNNFLGTLNIAPDNAFIPANLVAQAPFRMGTLLGDIGAEKPRYDRRIQRFLVGAEGTFDAFETEWKWDGYLSHGLAFGSSAAVGSAHLPNFNKAIDAVRNANGAIVCRSNLNGADPGCVPFNLFGLGVNGPAAIDYVSDDPFHITRMKQQVVAANISGSPFSTWAGPVSIATGFEHREESTRSRGNYGEGTTPTTWFISAGIPFAGKYQITEGYVEAVVPLAADETWAKSLELNGAVRATDYSTQGLTATWKVGVSYSPIDDLRFRATRSRDARSPTLVDLYSAGVTASFSMSDPFNGNQSVDYRSTTTGNPNIKSEIANSIGLGVVYQPSFIPRLNVSLDYYKIDIKGAIASFSASQLINLCFTGNQTACSTFTTVGTSPNGLPIYQFVSGPQNFATEVAKGLDIEASYQLPLDMVNEGWAGNLGFRMLATHYISSLLSSGAPGTIPSQRVGQNSGGLPKWRYEAALNYTLDPIAVNFTMRGLSKGVIDNNFITCTTGCPVSTGNNPTVNYNTMDSAMYFDMNVAYKIEMGEASEAELFFAVRNLANKDPAILYAGPGGSRWTFAPAAFSYDTLGRVYRAGVRFTM